MKIADTALILLASGLSRRFGEANKLLAVLEEQPLIQRTIDQTKDLPFGSLYAVIEEGNSALETILKENGFACLKNPNPAFGQGHSISIGTQPAIAAGFTSVCICLGDMPFVSSAHFIRLFEEYDSAEMVFSRSGNTPLPPALFSGSSLERLASLSGDQGARSLLVDGAVKFIDMPEEMAIDVDTPEILAALNKV